MKPRLLLKTLIVMLVCVLMIAQVQAQHQPTQDQSTGFAPTYEIFCTRLGLVGLTTANGHVVQPRDRFVALPSPSVLSPQDSYEHTVRITYNGRSVVLPVWDVGPWNIKDDYWSPNRYYADIPVGMPMTQAAYFDGYNGGLDEFGRRIVLPSGMDIADGAFWDDLGMTNNDWVKVSFLWMGDDPGPGAAVDVQTPPPDQENTSPAPDETQSPSTDPAPVEAEPTSTPTPNRGPLGATIEQIQHEDNGYRVWWQAINSNQNNTAYDVQVCQMPGCTYWRNWQVETTRTNAWFGPHEERDFGFRVRAYDESGNKSPWSSTNGPDMDTTQALPELESP